MDEIKHPAVRNLIEHQRRLDFDGIEVGVSRQALDETLVLSGELFEALQALMAELNEAWRKAALPASVTSPAIVQAAQAALAKAQGAE